MTDLDASSAPGPPQAVRPGPMKRLYLWVLHWADTPYGTPALFLLAVAESSFFPVPPDVLQIALSISKPRRSFFYAAISGLGSVVGGVLGWLIGWAFWSALGGWFMYIPGCTQENIDYVSRLYHDNAFLAILGAAFTPIPYKVFTITAGIFKVPIWVLVVASTIGRFGRFLAVGACIYWFGPSIRRALDRYFSIASLVFFVLLVAGFLAIKYLVR